MFDHRNLYMIEPLNSWEVSYVIKLKKPDWRLNISKESLEHVLPSERVRELQEWADTYFNEYWLYNHSK